jgi:hypothetical protein
MKSLATGRFPLHEFQNVYSVYFFLISDRKRAECLIGTGQSVLLFRDEEEE